MITRLTDGVSRGFTAPNGVLITAGPMDWARFQIMLDTEQAQQDALNTNTAAVATYMGLLHDYQIALTAARTLGMNPPTMPLRKIVSDPVIASDGTMSVGVATFIAFDPALPVAVTPATPTPSPIKAVNAPLSGTDQMVMSTLMALHVKVDALPKAIADAVIAAFKTGGAS